MGFAYMGLCGLGLWMLREMAGGRGYVIGNIEIGKGVNDANTPYPDPQSVRLCLHLL